MPKIDCKALEATLTAANQLATYVLATEQEKFRQGIGTYSDATPRPLYCVALECLLFQEEELYVDLAIWIEMHQRKWTPALPHYSATGAKNGTQVYVTTC